MGIRLKEYTNRKDIMGITMKLRKPIFLYIGLFFAAVCALFLLIWHKQFSGSALAVLAGLLIYVFLLLMIFLFIENNSITSRREVDEFYEALRHSLFSRNYSISDMENTKNDGADPTNVLELMSINMKEIKEYYVLSKNMARSSFRLSVSMCLLGFTLIASSIISVFILDSGLGSALVPAIGGAIVEVVAGTTLIVYKQSLDQLNKYYEALHENERFLSVVNITDKISLEKKDDVYMEIIRSQLGQKDTNPQIL